MTARPHRPHCACPAALALLAMLALTTAMLVARDAHAGCASTPMHWSRAAVSDHGQAVEHLTIRARGPGGDTFIRFALANAGFKSGELVVTFRQETSGGTIYGKQTFERGDYTIFADHFGLRAGKHAMEVKNGEIVASFDFGSAKASITMTTYASTLPLIDRAGSGYVARTLLAPVGRLVVKASDGNGRTADHAAIGFAVHEASTATAHQVYDRSVQLHSLQSGNFMVVDYIVLPQARGGRPLGFMVLSGKGKTFVGEIAQETRESEKLDSDFDYKVPYVVSVLGRRGEARAAVRLTAERQVGREDDLADLNFVARKAVGSLMHPVTYTLKARADAEIQGGAGAAAIALTGPVRFKYSQVR